MRVRGLWAYLMGMILGASTIGTVSLIYKTPVPEEQVLTKEQLLCYQVLDLTVRVVDLTHEMTGTGVVIWSGTPKDSNICQTYVLTNFHVIDKAEKLRIDTFRLSKLRVVSEFISYDAKVLMADKTLDLALLVFESGITFNAAKLLSTNDYNQLRLYDSVRSVGCGLGENPYVTSGRIITFKPELRINGFAIVGFSGGGVFVENGKLLGVNSQVLAVRFENEFHPLPGIAMAVSASQIRMWLLATPYEFVLN